MNVFVPGQTAEFLDAGLHIVPGERLAPTDRVQVDDLPDLLVRRYGLSRNVHSQRFLRLEHGDPKFALQADPALFGPDLSDGVARVATGENVGDVFGHGVRG